MSKHGLKSLQTLKSASRKGRENRVFEYTSSTFLPQAMFFWRRARCYYSACRRRGGVLKCPRFCFFCCFFFRCRKLINSTAKLSPGAVNRGDVLTACFRDIQSQRSIRMAFVIIMILFDVKDYRLLYGSISLSSEKIYT